MATQTRMKHMQEDLDRVERERDEARREVERLNGIIANAMALLLHDCSLDENMEARYCECARCVLDKARTAGEEG